MRRASAGSSVVTMPPSAVVIGLTGWKLKAVRSARVPTGRAAVGGAEGVAGVGDQRRARAARERAERVVVAGLAGVVDRHDGAGARA